MLWLRFVRYLGTLDRKLNIFSTLNVSLLTKARWPSGHYTRNTAEESKLTADTKLFPIQQGCRVTHVLYALPLVEYPTAEPLWIACRKLQTKFSNAGNENMLRYKKI